MQRRERLLFFTSYLANERCLSPSSRMKHDGLAAQLRQMLSVQGPKWDPILLCKLYLALQQPLDIILRGFHYYTYLYVSVSGCCFFISNT